MQKHLGHRVRLGSASKLGSARSEDDEGESSLTRSLLFSTVKVMNKTSDVLSPKYYVYLLLSLSDHKFYVGFTTDLKKRMEEHNRGYVTATKHRLPLKLIHYEYFINREDAIARETFLKSGFGREQIREALKRTLSDCLS